MGVINTFLSVVSDVVFVILRFLVSGYFMVGASVAFVFGAGSVAVIETRNTDGRSASEAVFVMCIVYILIILSIFVFRRVYGASLGLS